MRNRAKTLIVLVAAIVGLSGSLVHVQNQPRPDLPPGYFVKNMEVLAYLEPEALPFKMTMQVVNGRWYIYAGQLMQKEGWQIIDVTDPRAPKVVKMIEGPKNSMTFNIDMAEGKMVTALQRRFGPGPPYYGDPKAPADQGFYVWDVSDPINPKRLSHYNAGGVHRLGYQGGPFVHLPIGLPGYQGMIYQIVDWQKNAEVGRWWIPGQKEGEPRDPRDRGSVHGPPAVVGNTVYVPYGNAGLISLDITDPAAPKFLNRLDFSPPFNDGITVHGVLPLPGRGLAIVNSEAEPDDQFCEHAPNFVAMVDIKDPAKLRMVSLFPTPEAPPNAPYKDFCEKTGRFGPHNLHHMALHNPFVDKNENRAYVTYFNAGLRVYDTTNAHLPKEIAYFVPPDPRKLYGQRGPDIIGSSTDDVLVDSRGNIYVTHTNQGMWVLRMTGNN